MFELSSSVNHLFILSGLAAEIEHTDRFQQFILVITCRKTAALRKIFTIWADLTFTL